MTSDPATAITMGHCTHEVYDNYSSAMEEKLKESISRLQYEKLDNFKMWYS